MRLTEKQLGGWSLLIGTVLLAFGYALSPGRGAVDTVPSNSLTDLTLAMARNEALAYAMTVVVIFGALLMLNGLVTLRRHTAPVPRFGLMAMSVAVVVMMVMRGLDYMIVGMGVASLDSEPERSDEWLQSALAMQRMGWGMLFSATVSGFAGTAVLALGLAWQPEPLRLNPALNYIVAFLALVSLAVFVAAWHSDALELALAPAFAAMSIGGIVYMGLLGWRLASSNDDETSEAESEED